MIKLPLVGPAYKLNAQSMSCQNCINWYPQTIEYPNGSRVAALMPTPGLKKIFQGDLSAVRCLHVLSNGALLVVIGTKLYHSKSNKFELIEVGSISALNTVKVADNGIVAILVNGTYSYSLDMKTLELNRLSGSSIPRSTHVLFLDGRFIVNKANTGQFHWSDLYSDKFDALSYATAESSPDKITALTTFNRELWIFGAQTVERYYSTGSQNSPYARLSGGAMAFGCIAPDSIVALATGVIWLSQSEFGGHQIVMSGGGVPERISTHAIEEDISQYKKTTDAIAYAYQQEGHVFYVISFPSANTTFCFDVSTGLWHQRSFANEQGLHERHRSQHHAFFNGIHIVGDYKNGKLYQLDKQTFTDDGELILRERTAQAVITEGKTTRFNNLAIVCEVGFEEKAIPKITANYDSFYQTITVFGPAGLFVETKDPEGNVIGSGEIAQSGAVTYRINEGLLPKDTVISTSSSDSNVVNHNLLTSFYFAREAGAWYPYVFVQRDLNNGWIGESSDDYLPSNIAGEIIVEYGNEQYLVDLSDFAGEQQILLKKSGAIAYPYSYDSKSTNDLTEVKIRFRNVNSELFLQVGQADHFYKFFDDGVQQVGYQLAWRNSPTHADIVIKEIPNYLPSSVKNLNAMFWGDAEDSYLFDSADTESKLAAWDFSNVTKMITTFAYGKFYDLPISNLTLTNLVYAIETFAVSNFNKAINWTTPALQSVCYMFGDNIVFDSNIDLTFDNVIDASSFLQGAITFNKPLQHLNTASVENFAWFLSGCAAFNQPMNLLNVSSGTNFNYFYEGCSLFNQPMPSWDLASLVNTPDSSGLYGFLKNALNFSQDLSMWCVTPHPTEPSGFNQNGIMTFAQKPVWGTCPADTSWDVEYVLNGSTVRVLTGNPIPDWQFDVDTNPDYANATTLTINRTITSIGQGAFFGWSGVTSLSIPEGVTTIKDSAFRYFNSLTELVLPSSITNIQQRAFFRFAGVGVLNSVTCLAVTPPTAGVDLFGSNSVPIYVPAGSVNAYKAAAGWSSYSSNIFAIP
ncbi:packaged DNA stabilization protein [Acinetobacter junii]|uniref:packaged DNA stabilization protein n=1 Tax=Acinetobacter junii TaxID=40215 RepID=UPI003017E7FB